LTIKGAGFTEASEIVLTYEGTPFPIPRWRTTFLASDRVAVWAGLTEGDWIAKVTNQGGGEHQRGFSVSPSASSGRIALDRGLLDKISTLVDQNPNQAYYNPNWAISKEQYKAWIAVIAWAEGRRGGYGAHSQGSEDKVTKEHASTDIFNHREVGCKFRFSTGIGPFQIDRGGGTESWSTWPTKDKSDPDKAIPSILRRHKALDKPSLEKLTSVSCTATDGNGYPWCSLDSELKAKAQWEAVTGLDWEDHKATENDDSQTPIWNSIVNRLTMETSVTTFAEDVKHLGLQTWNIRENGGVKTETNRNVKFDGRIDTWIITARDAAGAELFKYYYAYCPAPSPVCNGGIEIWVWDNPDAPVNQFRYIYVREYASGHFPAHCLGDPGDENAGVLTRCAAELRPIAGEFRLTSPAITITGSTPGDLNQDGKVNIIDVSIMLSCWDKTDATCLQKADINGPAGAPDGKIDIYDGNKLIVNWTG
jgi:hypothetical protein